ncbi:MULTISPECIES: AI-2E family transporter [Polaromonas]|uniref:AI-2E family transporter n=1 Tax=Polaromonas aquatica TaxID=332657 RepID=A0ABW1U4R9_9BURK
MTPDRPAAEGQPFDTAQAAEIPEPDKPVEAPSGRAVGPADGTSPGRAGRVREPIVIHMPVNIRSLSLALLAMFAGLLVLYWAKAVFIPFMLGLIFSYALSPLVNWMELRRVPRWLGAALLLLAILGAMGKSAYSLSDEAARLVESLPAAAQKFGQAIKTRSGKSDSTLETVQKAATQIEQAAQDGAMPATSRGAMRVVVEPSRFNIKDYLWTGTLGLAALVGQVTVVVFLTYFLMVSGDTFRRKLVKLTGPSLARKKITLQALDEITGQIQRYLQVQLLTSALVGLLTGLALRILGLENAAVWGIAAGVFNLVPYVGSLVTAVTSALVGFLQFGSLNMALAVGGASLLIHTIVGNLLTPWLTSRASRMNPVAVFVGLLAWGWLWGVWGLLLGIPILMIVKSVCDRVDDLKPVGEFLGS